MNYEKNRGNSFLTVVLTLLFSFSAGAASVEYNYKGFQLHIPTEFIQDKQWAKKYNYVDYWHTENYMLEMVLIDTAFPRGELRDEFPDELFYDCHIINDELYGYYSDFISEQEIEFNGNKGIKNKKYSV